MSEDAPQFTPPEGEQPEQHQVAPEAQETTEELDSAAVEATQIPVQDSESHPIDNASTQWDESKASTVGMATREAGYSRDVHDPFKNEHLEWARGRMSMMDAGEQITWGGDAQEQAQKLETQKQIIAGYKERGEEVPEMNQRWLEEAETKLAQAKAEERKELEERLDKDTSEREEAIESITTPFEKLYDLNPELFAKMPTAEFINTYKELEAIDKEVWHSEVKLQNVTSLANHTAESIENQVPLTNIQIISMELSESMPHDSDVHQYTKRITEAYKKDIFNKTPRQIAEEIQTILNECVELARQQFTVAEQHKKEFMTKYGKKDEPFLTAERTS